MTRSTTRRGPGLHAPVFVRHAARWVYGQVVDVSGRDLVVQPGEGTTLPCRASTAHEVDPIIALLFGHSRPSSTLSLADVRADHATVLSRLLGDQLPPRSRPSRDIFKLLAGLVDDGGLPDGAAQCEWVSPTDGQREVDVTKPGRSQVPCTTSTDGGRHKLVLEELAAFPDVLEKYLAARARSSETTGSDVEEPRLLPSRLGDDDDWHEIEPKPKRQRCTSVDAAGEALLHHQSTQIFRPTTMQRQVHGLAHAPRTPGTSPHEFVTSLLAHNAVTFAPHPATLNRLYDFAFGVHGLSIMHLHHLESLARVSWVLASKEKGTKINMQNFSVNVELLTVAAPASLAQIQAALDSMKTYCDAFGSLSTCRVVQALRKVIQETAGLGFWETTDLKYLVYWIDTVLESSSSLTSL
ncbi:unnamed protein product [Phytophthora fragariaefolia]|uniref:Unnamed protein product n=1 Tax=Phytophthora fragariaefolia TaxID=1490495 RepID=A0A9W6Y4N0_9STRA|nr:unnamed protein product [Phytophthora fragariaefolia]